MCSRIILLHKDPKNIPFINVIVRHFFQCMIIEKSVVRNFLCLLEYQYSEEEITLCLLTQNKKTKKKHTSQSGQFFLYEFFFSFSFLVLQFSNCNKLN